MLQGEHSAIHSTLIKTICHYHLCFVYFEWTLKTGASHRIANKCVIKKEINYLRTGAHVDIGPEIIKRFLCLTELSTKFILSK